MHVIGTAGHVDHGKSSLVKALTGTDPDRLREEKERGLTIELGFALLTLPNGDEAGIVDVPGHERFIKTMLAGVGGIDLALLVVAADEGVMPQTREHLAIIDLLGIEHGVVALTKSDLVEPDTLELAAVDVAEQLAGTTLESAAIIPCSATTRAGLDDLLRALADALATVPARPSNDRPRLPIDRVFTMPGFGTVVTGTLTGGSIREGDEVEVQPSSIRSRVRGLQSHNRPVETASPGSRTAVNLANVAVDELHRGMVLTTPGWLTPATAVDVRLHVVRNLGRPVRHNLEATLHSGAAEANARVLLLDRDELQPGETCWAQVRLADPIAVVAGDRFIIRDPNDTLGGGTIVDTQPQRHRRFHAATIAALERIATDSPEQKLLRALEAAGPLSVEEASTIARLDREGTNSCPRRRHMERGDRHPRRRFTRGVGGRLVQANGRRSRPAPGVPRRQSPPAGMPAIELRSELGLDAGRFDRCVAAWTSTGEIEVRGTDLALPSQRPRLGTTEQGQADMFLDSLRTARYSPPAPNVGEAILAYLIDRGDVIRTADGVVFAREAYDEMATRITTHIGDRGSVTIAEVRDMFGTSRKYAQAVLEHLDATHVTRRSGDAHVLRKQ